MLSLIPVLVLMSAAGAIAVLRRVRSGVGYSWLAAVAASLLALGVVVFLRFRLPFSASFGSWERIGGPGFSPEFVLDETSWVFVFSLALLAVGVVFTAAARLHFRLASVPAAWAASLGLIGVGMLAAMSSNTLALALTWTTLDLAELLVFAFSNPDRPIDRRVVLTFSARVTGTMVAATSTILQGQGGAPLDLRAVSPEAGRLLMLGVGLRLGVFPLHLPYLQEGQMRRGLGTVLRVAGSASAMMALVHIPPDSLPPLWRGGVMLALAITVFYAAAMWMASNDELSGRPYWLIALSGLALSSAIRGQSAATAAWGAMLVLGGGTVFLASSRQSVFVRVWLALLGLGAFGLPFTPTDGVWQNLAFNGPGLLLVGGQVLLVIGGLRLMQSDGDDLAGLERWIQVVYPLGITLMTAGWWVMGAMGWIAAERFTTPIWPTAAGLALTAVAVGGAALARRYGLAAQLNQGWSGAAIRGVSGALAGFFSLGWLYRGAELVFAQVRQVVGQTIRVLEGDGGVLWTLVLLALLITLLRGSLP